MVIHPKSAGTYALTFRIIIILMGQIINNIKQNNINIVSSSITTSSLTFRHIEMKVPVVDERSTYAVMSGI